MKGMMSKLKNSIYSNRKMLWYMLMFALLGLIDQRKQSAPGEIQMLFGNSTALVMAGLLLPSLDLHKFREKAYLNWTPICLILAVVACIWGKFHMPYMQAWVPTVLSVAVWSYLFIYTVREWKTTEGPKRVWQPFFWCVLLLLLCMMLSVYRDSVPYWYLMMYGGFFLIGIGRDERKDFLNGMLNGIILWFFVQQIIAFGFRPYDSYRYRGMYAWVTFNGLFYLIVYCAVSLKWLLAKEKMKHWFIRFFWFFLSTGCISFVLLTGGRAALVGAVLVTVIIYGWYDLRKRNSFYRLVLHAATWILCVVISFPMVYGCVRYLPTILHHPIWFAGEYVEGMSVCSFDPWDSEKYVSFEKALEKNVGRILEMFGIKLSELKLFGMDEPLVMRVYAEEGGMAEVTSEEILNKLGLEKFNGGIDSRKLVYLSTLAQLNWQGHTSGGIYAADGNLYSHAHNMFLDMAYKHGILAGVLYLGICGYSVLQVLWKRKRENIYLIVFMSALLSFGMFEQLTLMGQFGLALIWIFFYFAGEDSVVLRIGKKSEG